MYGEKIKYFRNLKGYSQVEMSRKLNMAKGTYNKIENGETHLAVDMLKKIAEVLEIPPIAILNDEPININFNDYSSNNGTCVVFKPENFFSYQKDLVEKLEASKNSEVIAWKDFATSQERINKDYKNLINQLTSLVEKL